MNAGPEPVWGCRLRGPAEPLRGGAGRCPGGLAQKTTSSQNNTNGDVSLKRGPFLPRAVNSLLPGCCQLGGVTCHPLAHSDRAAPGTEALLRKSPPGVGAGKLRAPARQWDAEPTDGGGWGPGAGQERPIRFLEAAQRSGLSSKTLRTAN